MIKKLAFFLPLISIILMACAPSAYAIPTVPPVSGLPSGDDPVTIILEVIVSILEIIAVVAVVVIIIAGIFYIFSLGDEDASRRARNTIVYTVVGLIIIGLSIVIVNFVLNAINAV